MENLRIFNEVVHEKKMQGHVDEENGADNSYRFKYFRGAKCQMEWLKFFFVNWNHQESHAIEAKNNATRQNDHKKICINW